MMVGIQKEQKIEAMKRLEQEQMFRPALNKNSLMIMAKKDKEPLYKVKCQDTEDVQYYQARPEASKSGSVEMRLSSPKTQKLEVLRDMLNTQKSLSPGPHSRSLLTDQMKRSLVECDTFPSLRTSTANQQSQQLSQAPDRSLSKSSLRRSEVKSPMQNRSSKKSVRFSTQKSAKKTFGGEVQEDALPLKSNKKYTWSNQKSPK